MPDRERQDLNAAAVTAFFDGLLLERAEPDQVLQRAARFAGASVGRVREDGTSFSRDADGAALAGGPPVTASSAPVPAVGGRVWVNLRSDDTVRHFLERMAVTLAIAERSGSAAPDLPPLVVLVDRSSTELAREYALARLALSRHTRVRVVLCGGPDDAVDAFARRVANATRVIARAEHLDKTVLLVTADADTDELTLSGVPTGVRAAYSRVGPAGAVPEAYGNAHDAYRFSRPSPSDVGPYQPISGVLIDGSRIAGLAALCRLSYEDIAVVPEIAALDGLVEHHGEQMLHLLEAYTITGSLRKAAAQLYLHHNSVAYWVQKAEREFGYPLTEPNRRAQLFITLCLYRLWKNDDRRLQASGSPD